MKNLTTENTERARLISNAPNAALHETGKTYAKRLERLRAGGKKKAAVRDVATELNVSAEEVKKAIDFVNAVDLIAGNCRGNTRKLLLADHPRLPVEVVLKISRTRTVNSSPWPKHGPVATHSASRPKASSRRSTLTTRPRC